MLIISVILQLEQRKGNRKEPEKQRSKMPKVPEGFSNIPGSRRQQVEQDIESIGKGDMTYVNA